MGLLVLIWKIQEGKVMELNTGDEVLYRKDGKLYKGIIKSICADKVEIDDRTIEMVIAAISKGSIADRLTFKDKKIIDEIWVEEDGEL